MGDHRASVEIKFSMHGVERKTDFWINYHPCDDVWNFKVDRRVLQWLTDVYEEAMGNYFDEQYAADMVQRAETENAEREQLASLKAKYEQGE